ncbi:MAG: hypothetical protein M1826_004197 [Phylliscum demangeonii]|nr:MAG: hypothetical protein M1826_004197 [Phylliscum demangeonii]
MVVLNLCIVAAVAFMPAWGLPHVQGSPPSFGGEGGALLRMKHVDNAIHDLWQSDPDHKFLPAQSMLPKAFERDPEMRRCVVQAYLEKSIGRSFQNIDPHFTWDTGVNKCLEKLHRPDADKHD